MIKKKAKTTPVQDLLILADIIENSNEGGVLENECFVGRDKLLFDMSNWTTSAEASVWEHDMSWLERNAPSKSARDKIARLEEHGCGTAACALGTAGYHRHFRDKGLVTAHGTVSFEGYHNAFTAAREFFDINYMAAQDLFAPTAGYTTPKQVAIGIRRYVKTGKLPGGGQDPDWQDWRDRYTTGDDQ